MTLLTNAPNTAFASAFDIDKIVGVWEGSYNRNTDVTTRTYTFLGSPYDVFVYRIPHGFTRPVFCDLLWSSDNVTFSDNLDSIAWSDSTYIYIYDSQAIKAAGTAYYKVIAFWITDYDTTNPLVASYLSPNKRTNFDSRLNYQKIYKQNVLTFNNPPNPTTATLQAVSHGLGYYPNHRVFFEAFSGEVWPANAGGASNLFLFSDDQVECQPYVDTNNLQILCTFATSVTTPTARAWYRIYLDA